MNVKRLKCFENNSAISSLPCFTHFTDSSLIGGILLIGHLRLITNLIKKKKIISHDIALLFFLSN